MIGTHFVVEHLNWKNFHCSGKSKYFHRIEREAEQKEIDCFVKMIYPQ